eukprot:jgi/Ulvmu1/11464/UM077_0007.1
MDKFEEKMRGDGLSDAAVAAFLHNYEQLVAGADGIVPEGSIEAIETLPVYEELTEPEDAQTLLSATAVLKLNGGLGTSMGLEKAKSLLPVKDGKTFLDLIAEQVKKMRESFGSNVRFVLMNSFSTSADTTEHLSGTHPDLVEEEGWELLQNKSPKVDAETMDPVEYPDNPDMEWCPPGHGDIYPSLLGSGMLDKLLSEGIKYVFVSNSDNLGATLDLKLLNHFATSEQPFCMEVAVRTVSDKKGGHLCRRTSDGKLMLRESAMCAPDDKEAFEDITTHKFFNTNNLWVNLEALQAAMAENDGMLPLPLIKNKKTVNPRDSSTPAVFQLETAMGSAIECFEGAGAVVVPRSRFAPVKTCSDLFCLRSDAYTVTDASTVELAVEEQPFIKLDDKHYKLVDKMEALVEEYPSLAGCTSLKVTGPVNFAAGVAISGAVEVINLAEEPVTLMAGEYADTTVDITEQAAVPA